ncbi:MAG: BolA family protein [Alphaproteobacteria bacterium]|nr:BolA family protein [Alphaproteobacteria bacterium]
MLKPRHKRMLDLLQRHLDPDYLELIDDSQKHVGHRDNLDETHFRLIIKSKILENLSRLEAHRRIHDLLHQEFSDGLHALNIKILRN